MKAFFQRFRFSMLGVAVLCIGIGLLILWRLSLAQIIFCYAFGALLVVSGLLQIATYLIGRNRSFLSKVLFVGGIIAVVAGIWVLITPSMIASLTVIVMGVILLYHGARDIRLGLELHEYGRRSMSASVLLGVITCGLGVVMLINPFKTVSALFLLVGSSFLFDGASALYTVFAVERSERLKELETRKAAGVIEAHGEELETVPEQ